MGKGVSGRHGLSLDIPPAGAMLRAIGKRLFRGTVMEDPRDEEPRDTDKPVENDSPRSFEDALSRLDAIIKRLEADSTSLEESLSLFEDGIALSRYCAGKLDEAEQKVLMLTENAEGELRTEAMRSEPDSLC